jgi:hypothetical protein
MTRMISRTLSIALRETIQQHAETFHGGKMDVDRTLSAIGALASDFLAEILDHADRSAHFSALIHGIGNDTRQKIGHQAEQITRQ